MTPDEFDYVPGDTPPDGSTISCDACQSTLATPGRERVSFLLMDDLRIPLVGCAEHKGAFRAICGMTTDTTAQLLQHRPAGGLACPGCRHAPQIPAQAMLPVRDGAIALLACPEHQAAITMRFQTGLHAHRQLTTNLTTSP